MRKIGVYLRVYGAIIGIISIALYISMQDVFQKGLCNIYRWNYYVYHYSMVIPEGYIRRTIGNTQIIYSKEIFSEDLIERVLRGEYCSKDVQKNKKRFVKEIWLSDKSFILKCYFEQFSFSKLLFPYKIVRSWNNGHWLEKITNVATPVFISRSLDPEGCWNFLIMPNCGPSIGVHQPPSLQKLVSQVRGIQRDLDLSGHCHLALSCSNMVTVDNETYLVDFDDACQFIQGSYISKWGRDREARDFDEAEKYLQLVFRKECFLTTDLCCNDREGTGDIKRILRSQ